MTHCQEVQRHHDAAYAALEKADRHPLPGRDYWRELYEAEKQAAETAALAHEMGAALVTCFIRQVALSYKYEGDIMSIDTDLAAQKTFQRFLEMGHEFQVPIIPVYDHGPDAAVLLAEAAAMNGCDRVLIGTSRRGVIYHLVKGSFQRRLETLLPPEIPVQVIATEPPLAPQPHVPTPVPN